MIDLIAYDCRSELESNNMRNDVEIGEQLNQLKTPGISSLHQISDVVALELLVMH